MTRFLTRLSRLTSRDHRDASQTRPKTCCRVKARCLRYMNRRNGYGRGSGVGIRFTVSASTSAYHIVTGWRSYRESLFQFIFVRRAHWRTFPTNGRRDGPTSAARVPLCLPYKSPCRRPSARSPASTAARRGRRAKGCCPGESGIFPAPLLSAGGWPVKHARILLDLDQLDVLHRPPCVEAPVDLLALELGRFVNHHSHRATIPHDDADTAPGSAPSRGACLRGLGRGSPARSRGRAPRTPRTPARRKSLPRPMPLL